MFPYTPPLIHQMATPPAMSGLRAAVRREIRAPPEPPVMTVGPKSSWRRRRASESACITDSDGPVKLTEDAPQFRRS